MSVDCVRSPRQEFVCRNDDPFYGQLAIRIQRELEGRASKITAFLRSRYPCRDNRRPSRLIPHPPETGKEWQCQKHAPKKSNISIAESRDMFES